MAKDYAIGRTGSFMPAPGQTVSHPDRLPTNIQPIEINPGDHAAQLAKIFGGVTNTAEGAVQQWHHHEQQIHATRGAMDSMAGKKDKAAWDQSQAYRTSWNTVNAHTLWNQEFDKLQQEAEQYRADHPNATPEDVNKNVFDPGIESFLKAPNGQLQHGMDDPKVAAAILPTIMKDRVSALDKIHAEVKQQQDQEFASGLESWASSMIKHDGTVDWHKLHKAVRARYPGTQANALLANVAASVAASSNNPEVIKSIPQKWADGTPTFRNIPKYAAGLEKAQSVAQSGWDKAHAAQKQTQIMEALSPILHNIKQGIPVTEKDVAPLVQHGYISGSRAAELMNESNAAGKKAADLARNVALMQASPELWPKYMKRGEAQKAVDFMWSHMDPKHQAQFTVDILDKGGIVPTQIRNAMDIADPNRPHQFDAAFQQWQEAYQIDPSAAGKLTNDATEAEFRLYQVALDNGATPQQAIKDLQQAAKEGGAQNVEHSITFHAVDKALSDHTFGEHHLMGFIPHGGTDFTDLKNPQAVKARVRSLAELYRMRGAPTTQAITMAIKQVDDRSKLLDGHLIPQTQSMPKDLPQAYEWFRKTKLPGMLKKDGWSPDMVMMVPDANTASDPGTFKLRVAGTFTNAVPGKQFSYQDIVHQYHQHLDEERRKAQADYSRRIKDIRDNPPDVMMTASGPVFIESAKQKKSAAADLKKSITDLKNRSHKDAKNGPDFSQILTP